MGATKRLDQIPISRREFEAGRTGPEFTIINLLQRNGDRAFTALKIRSDLDSEGYLLDLLSLQELLETLTIQGEIESKVVTTPEGQAMYFAYAHGVGYLHDGAR